jgi:hypothetical protein
MNNSPNRLGTTATAMPLVARRAPPFPNQHARRFDAALMTFAH